MKDYTGQRQGKLVAVHYVPTETYVKWRVYYGRKFLGRTSDFFEACCTRKSAEVHGG